jgi:hypothetical protein
VGEIGHCTRCGEGLSLSLPQSINVVVAATRAFDKDHSRCKPSGYAEPQPRTTSQWADGRDVGISAFTIYSVMTGKPTRMDRYDTPKDPADFGRCYRFLALFPQFRSRLSEVSKRFPEWLPLVSNWDELESLFYVAALKDGGGEPLYARIKELNADCLYAAERHNPR